MADNIGVAFGNLKNKWSCLKGLTVQEPQFAAEIATAYAALHNLALRFFDARMENFPPEEEAPVEIPDDEKCDVIMCDPSIDVQR